METEHIKVNLHTDMLYNMLIKFICNIAKQQIVYKNKSLPFTQLVKNKIKIN